jgi:hypothetical protein
MTRYARRWRTDKMTSKVHGETYHHSSQDASNVENGFQVDSSIIFPMGDNN